jgi:hypothetical protein
MNSMPNSRPAIFEGVSARPYQTYPAVGQRSVPEGFLFRPRWLLAVNTRSTSALPGLRLGCRHLSWVCPIANELGRLLSYAMIDVHFRPIPAAGESQWRIARVNNIHGDSF